MKSITKILVGVVIVVMIAITSFSFLVMIRNQENAKTKDPFRVQMDLYQWPSTTAKYITAVPMNLSQIQSISKFRSCCGHDRSGYNFDRMLETDRSMKHYITPLPEFYWTIDKVTLFAPMNGTITLIQRIEEDANGETESITEERLLPDGGVDVYIHSGEGSGRIHTGDAIFFSTPVDPNVIVGFVHVTFARNFTVGETVEAGDFIGYACVYGYMINFDIDCIGKTKLLDGEVEYEVLDSAFNHMTDSVLAEFAKYGVTPENVTFSIDERDAMPCGYNGPLHNNSPLGTNEEMQVYLKHP
jgi:hypothetical protein